jgi:hypothetical protein
MAVIIKDIKKNNSEIIRIEVSEFQGKELISIRIWYSDIDSYSGELIYKPSPKGVALNISEFAELQDGINKLANYVNDKKTGNIPEQFTESIDDEKEV